MPTNAEIKSSSGSSLAIGSTITSATQGSILFAGVGGILAQDNSNIFWDDTNNRLGIGINTPSYTVDTLGSGTTAASIAARFIGGTGAASGGLLIGSYGSTTGAIWSNNVTPSTSNYAITSTGAVTTVNATTTLNLSISDTPRIILTTNTIGIPISGISGASALHGYGTPFAGGTGSDTKPYWLIEPTGTTSNNWSTLGTLLGLNAPSGFGGRIFDVQINGVDRFNVTIDGTFLKGAGATSATNSLLVKNSSGTNLFRLRDDGNSFFEGGGAVNAVGLNGTVYGLFGGLGYSADVVLGANSTTSGFLPPRMTTTQKNAISSPTKGLIVFDNTLNKICVFTTSWETVTSV